MLRAGVQIIFAFLLAIAFTARFPQLTDTQQDVYLAALLLSVLSAAVFATPVLGRVAAVVVTCAGAALFGLLGFVFPWALRRS